MKGAPEVVPVPENTLQEQTFCIACSCAKWPPDFSRISSLGFDSIAASGREAVVRKAQGAAIFGRQGRFVEIRIRKEEVRLRYACPKGADPHIWRLHATLLLLRVLRLLPSIKADAASLAEFILPALELSEQVASQPYESLRKRYADLEADFAGLSSRNRRAMRTAEEEAARMLELESENGALQERVAKLEAVPDTALREMLLAWLSTHRGSFDVAEFSAAKNVPPARCEEGLEALMQEGAIIRLGNGACFQAGQKAPKREFALPPKGILSFLRRKRRLIAENVK
ncbi:Uncharacterised protein [uncultured archaeon]|nr:Uncharacterised protein [uncultured archaeon]